MLRHWLILIVLASSAAPASAQSPAEIETKKLLGLLSERIETKDFANPLTLGDALGHLHDKFAGRQKDLNIFINIGLYRNNGEPNVNPYDCQVSLPTVPHQLPVRMVLDLLLAQIPEPSTYLIRQGMIEILPRRLAGIDELLQRPIAGSFDKMPLREILQQLADDTGATINLGDTDIGDKGKMPVSGTFRNNATLQDAIAVLANQVGLRMVVLRNSVYVTTAENAAQLERDAPTKVVANPPAFAP